METLKAKVSRIRAALRTKDIGPLLMAAEVLAIVNEWESYKDEEGGKDAPQWVRETFGLGICFFQNRLDAMHVLGKDVAIRMNHEAAAWLAGRGPVGLPEVKDLVSKRYRERSSNCLSVQQVRKIWNDVTGHTPLKRECVECVRLRAELDELRATRAA